MIWLGLLIASITLTKTQQSGDVYSCHTMKSFNQYDMPYTLENKDLVPAHPDGKWVFAGTNNNRPYYIHKNHGYYLRYVSSTNRWNVINPIADNYVFMYCESEWLFYCWQNTWFYINKDGEWDGPAEQGGIYVVNFIFIYILSKLFIIL